MATELAEWIGRSECATDRMSPSVIARLAATLDHENDGDLWTEDAEGFVTMSAQLDAS